MRAITRRLRLHVRISHRSRLPGRPRAKHLRRHERNHEGNHWPLHGHLRKNTVMSPDLQKLAEEDFCYLTTTGRISGRPHTIEIWFALHEQTLYLLSGGRDKSDWVKNALHTPTIQMKINNTIFTGTARL